MEILRELPLDSALAAARLEYRDGDLTVARELLEAVSSRALEAEDTAVRADALTWLSYATRWLGEYDASRAAATEAVDLRERSGLDEELWRSHNALGLVSWWQSRLVEAMRHFGAALRAAEATGNRGAMAQVENNRGLVYFDLGEIEAARERFQSLLRIARTIGDSLEEARGSTNLGMASLEAGDIAAAISSLEDASRLYSTSGPPRERQVALGLLGSAYLARGEFDRAFSVLDTALVVTREASLPSDEAQTLELLAAARAESGDLGRALEIVRKAQGVHLALGDDLIVGRNLRTESEWLAELGELVSAREAALRALELHGALGASWDQVRDRIVLSHVASLAGDDAEAEMQLAAADRLAREFPAVAPRFEVALARARAADAIGDADATLEALAHLRALGPPFRFSHEWETEALAARAYSRKGDLEAAIAHGREAVGLIERVRGGLGSTALRSSLVTARTESFGDLVQSLVLTGRTEEAFAVADAARGRVLAEHLGARARIEGDDATTDQIARSERLLRRISVLRARLDSLEATPAEEVDSIGFDETRELLAGARREYEDLAVVLDSDPSAESRALGFGEVDLTTVRNGLEAGDALLEYLVTKDETLVFVVTGERLSVSSIDVGEERLLSRVRLARERLQRTDLAPDDTRHLLEQLYREVIEPALRAAPITSARRLIIVPHGPLTYLPFAALRDPLSGEYLAERYDLVHLPSASALPLLSGRPGFSRKADPLRDGLAIFVPFPERLPATGVEARAVQASVTSNTIVQGPASTESRVRSALAGGRAVHVAGHAALEPNSPMFSRVELARGSDDPRDDGVLEVHEVMSLSIESPFIFLSGCETALGRTGARRVAQGEDFATLAQAFLYAGADAVIGTLWPIEDEGAARFAAAFYRRLGGGASISEALGGARRELMSSERFAAPFYWAGYRVSGW